MTAPVNGCRPLATALMFPGQGSQFPGMAMDIAQNNARAGELLKRADEILGYYLSSIMAGEHGDRLNLTVHTQPAVFVHSMMALSVLQEHGAVVPLIAGGHSLGEYSALCAAGVMDFEQALETVRVRAEAMDRAQPPGTSGMAAIMGCVQEDVLRVVEEQRGDDVLEAANFNAPDQVVVSGRLSAVNRVLEAAKGLKRARAVMLPVSSAFHTVLMDSARDALSKRLNEIDIRQPRFRVAANVNGEEYASPDAAKDLLLEQLVRPVRWDACVRKMREAGAELFLEIGPGKVLTGLLKRIDKNAKGVAISSFEDIQRFVGETQ